MKIFNFAMTRQLKKIIILGVSVLLLPLTSFAEDQLFPIYPEIESNVAFWQDVYARYTTDQGVLHDDKNLNLVYGVIPLEPQTNPNYRKINKKRIDAAKKKYREIFDILSRNPDKLDPEAKRIAILFGPDTDTKTFQKAKRNIRCQRGQKDRFLEGLKRSGAYLNQIIKIFEFYNVPTDLAYLPHVESSFDIKAYSKFGAAGMWQFTVGTGMRFLKIGYTLDERRDPTASSHAAALLLKENYEKLGSWPLAITAYNHGAAGMKRAQQQWGDYPQIFSNYRGRAFKFASRNFYSEFIAARNIARSHEHFFGEITFDPPHKTHSIVLEGFADLEDIAAVFGVNIPVLAELNPAIRPPVFKGQKYLPQGYRLHLPISVDTTESDIASLFPRKLYYQEQRPSHFYAVQRGDTAGKIARMHNVDLDDLLLANNLNRKAIIYINQNLRIPITGEHQNQPPASSPSVAMLEIPKIPQPILATILPITFGKPESPSSQSTDTSALSAALPTSNTPINPEVINGHLKIEKVWTEKDRVFGLVKVEVEETLGHFADWLEVETRVLRQLNGLRYGHYVHVGQSLEIPLDRVAKELFEEKRFDFHKRLQEDFFSAYQIEDLQPYYVRKGETIWMISNEKFNLPIWLIQQCNPAIDFRSLRQSQKLMIPIVGEKS